MKTLSRHLIAQKSPASSISVHEECSYCGSENKDASSNCRECGVEFEQHKAPGLVGRPSLSVFPRSPDEWTRSFALPLFISCVVVLLWAFGEGFEQNRFWRDVGPAITKVLLPLLGVSLGLTCLFGTGLQRGFRILALVVSFLSLVGGLLAPALAE